MKITYIFLVGLVIGCAPRAAHEPYANAERDCTSFDALVRRGEGAPHMIPPLWRVRACPSRAGELIAQAILTSAAQSDVVVLERSTFLAQYVHDRRIIDAAAQVAVSNASTPESRIASLRVLTWAKAPGHLLSFTSMVAGPRCVPPECASTYTGHFYGPGPFAAPTIAWPVIGEAADDSYVAGINATALAIVADETAPSEVRNAARTVLLYPQDRQLSAILAEARGGPDDRDT